MSIVPEEFRLKDKKKDDDNHLLDIFSSESDDDNDDIAEEVTSVIIGEYNFKIQKPPDIGTLFAHQIWSGSKLLSDYICSNPDIVRGKRTIEFGAGTSLPSLCSIACGSSFSVITDYPDEEVLQAIRETVGYNWETLGSPLGRVKVFGHEWGTEITDLVGLKGAEEDENDTDTELYDLAILSECIWNHAQHGALAKSLNDLLHPEHGMAIVVYCHHIPGLEEKDDAFFVRCNQDYGMKTEKIMTTSVEYMWDKAKTIDSNLRIIRRG